MLDSLVGLLPFKYAPLGPELSVFPMSQVASRGKEIVIFHRYLLREGLVLDFDVFNSDTSNPHIRTIRKGTPVKAEAARYASSNSSLCLIVASEDAQAYRDLIESIVNGGSESGELVSDFYRDVARMQLIRRSYIEATETGETELVFESAGVNAERIVPWFEAKIPLKNLLKLLESPPTWQNLAVNTATLFSLFAHSIGIKGSSLTELTRGALLADIGYLDVDRDALKAFSAPSIEEQRKLDAHPLFGLRRLSSIRSANWAQLMMVYQHQERIDKRGFPVGIPGDQITIGAKLLTVADRFLSLCGNKHPYTSVVIQEAMSKLEKEIDTRITKEHFQCWKSLVQSAL